MAGLSSSWRIVERKNHHAVHGLFATAERAERHLREIIPVYVQRGYFSDKTLKVEDFEVLGPHSSTG